MEIGQSGVTDVAITAKPGFALWSKAGVTIELSDGRKWEEGEEKGGGANHLISGWGWGCFSKPLPLPPNPWREICVCVYLTNSLRESFFGVSKHLLAVCLSFVLIRFGTNTPPTLADSDLPSE